MDKLYKFCPIGVYSLRAISEAEVHHTSPTAFNDPLDCNPTIQMDISDKQVVDLLVKMLVGTETQEEIDAWIETLSWVDGPDDEDQMTPEQNREWVKAQVVNRIKSLLNKEFGTRGVLSLSEKWSEPLMWSHYADQHRGICIEYDTTKWKVPTLGQVNYNSQRSIRLNDLFRWKVEGDAAAEKRVYETYFFAKAPEWEYEREWRDVYEKAGVNELHFDLTAIYFGMRCDPVWQRTVVKLLAQNHEIDLFQIKPKDETFGLERISVAREKFEGGAIRQPAFKVFGDFVDSDSRPPDTTDLIVKLLMQGSGAEKAVESVDPKAIGGIFGLLGPLNMPDGKGVK